MNNMASMLVNIRREISFITESKGQFYTEKEIEMWEFSDAYDGYFDISASHDYNFQSKIFSEIHNYLIKHLNDGIVINLFSEDGLVFAIFYKLTGKKIMPGPAFKNRYFDVLSHIVADDIIIVSGFLPIHCSCVKSVSHSVLFVGPSGSGKTTLALKSETLNSKFLANDRVYITTDGDVIICESRPINIGLGSAVALNIISSSVNKFRSCGNRELFDLGDYGQVQMERLPRIFNLEKSIDTLVFPSISKIKKHSENNITIQETISLLKNAIDTPMISILKPLNPLPAQMADEIINKFVNGQNSIMIVFDIHSINRDMENFLKRVLND